MLQWAWYSALLATAEKLQRLLVDVLALCFLSVEHVQFKEERACLAVIHSLIHEVVRSCDAYNSTFSLHTFLTHIYTLANLEPLGFLVASLIPYNNEPFSA